MTVRLSINLNDELAEVLKTIADKRGITATEAIRRAIAWYKFIDDEVIDGGSRIQLVDRDGDRVKEVVPVG